MNTILHVPVDVSFEWRVTGLPPSDLDKDLGSA